MLALLTLIELTLLGMSWLLYVLYRAVIRRPIVKPRPRPEHRLPDRDEDLRMGRVTGDNLIPL